MTDHWRALSEQIADTALSIFSAKIEQHVSKLLKSQIRICYSETEAAAELKVAKSTLADWRKSGLIGYSRYPQAKTDALGDIYTYSENDLREFRARYAIRSGGNVSEIRKAA
jgi:hypothetical protein